MDMNIEQSYNLSNAPFQVPMSLGRWLGTLHYICKGWGSNPRHPTFTLRGEFLATGLLDQKNAPFHIL